MMAGLTRLFTSQGGIGTVQPGIQPEQNVSTITAGTGLVVYAASVPKNPKRAVTKPPTKPAVALNGTPDAAASAVFL